MEIDHTIQQLEGNLHQVTTAVVIYYLIHDVYEYPTLQQTKNFSRYKYTVDSSASNGIDYLNLRRIAMPTLRDIPNRERWTATGGRCQVCGDLSRKHIYSRWFFSQIMITPIVNFYICTLGSRYQEFRKKKSTRKQESRNQGFLVQATPFVEPNFQSAKPCNTPEKVK